MAKITGLPTPTTDSYALITGASQGIGEAMARDLAAMGYNTILVARRESVLEEIATQLREQGTKSLVVAADLSQAGDVDRLLEVMGEHEISILINSAGIASFGPFMEQDWEYETNQFALNATAVHRLTHGVLKQMLPRRRGAICNVGSAAGNVPIPNNATYVLTKAGVNAFTEALHYELKKDGISCTLLAPGPVREAVVPEAEKTIVDKVVPDFLWTTYQSCSKETLEGMAKNQRRVVPGPLGKAMNLAGLVLPTALTAPLIGSFYAKMA